MVSLTVREPEVIFGQNIPFSKSVGRLALGV